MSGIFEKIRVSALAGVHGVLDKVIDLNKVGVVEQYIRELEDERKKLQDELAGQKHDLAKRKGDLVGHKARDAVGQGHG